MSLWSAGGPLSTWSVIPQGLPQAFSRGLGKVPKKQKQKLQSPLRPRPLPPHLISPSESQGQPGLQGSGNRSHLLMGRARKCHGHLLICLIEAPHFTWEAGGDNAARGNSRSGAPPTDPDLNAFELGKADLTEEAAPRGPRQVSDKHGLDSRRELRTLNLSLRLEG